MQLTNSIYCIKKNYCNSYIIIDNQIVIIDVINEEWFQQVIHLLSNRQPDYFIITHQYHSSAILSLCQKYPHMKLIINHQISDYLNLHISNPIHIIDKNETMTLDHHTLLLQVINDMILIYHQEKKILFSSHVFSTKNLHQLWNEEARYYYVQNKDSFTYSLLDILKSFDYTMICPYKGQIITHHFKQYIHYLELWLSSIPEEDGVLILTHSDYILVYQACLYLQEELIAHGDNVLLYDISKGDLTFANSLMLKYDRIIIGGYRFDSHGFVVNNRVFSGIFDSVNEAIDLKNRLLDFNNILYVEPTIINQDYQLLMNLLVHQIMEVGCSNGVCV